MSADADDPTQNPDDPTHLARLEAETEAAAQAENDAMLIGMSPWLMMGGCLVLFVMSPLLVIWLGALPFGNTSAFTAWIWVSFPLIVYAALVARRGRFRMPGGTVYEGWRVRVAAGRRCWCRWGCFWCGWGCSAGGRAYRIFT